MIGATLLGKVRRRLARPVARRLAGRWEPYSRLLLVGDSAAWVLDGEVRELASIASRLGIRLADPRWWEGAERQSVFYSHHFVLNNDSWRDRDRRVGLAYFHGRPGHGVPEFDTTFQRLRRLHDGLHRVQVSHRAMREVVLESGIAPEKVFLIPIAVNLAFFTMQTGASRHAVRERYQLPQSAVIVGSFQKDGVGWGAGREPKLIKGPDVLLQTLDRLRTHVPELYVLLSGPARGYVKAGLENLSIPYRHVYAKDYGDVGQLYQALDLYLVTSRDEGGPKAVLESMASGVPLVTTRVGQAMDLVKHGENGWMVGVDDVDGLAQWSEFVLAHRASLSPVTAAARRTAEAHTYLAQIPRWREFWRGFVDFPEGKVG